MKFRTESIIASSVYEVTKLFENQTHNEFWNSNFVRVQQDKYNACKSVHFYNINGRTVEVNVDIIENNLPENYRVYCEMGGLKATVNHIFLEHDQNQTKWIVETGFITESIFLKVMMFLLPGMFRKNTNIYVRDFKKFAEGMKIEPNLILDLI